MTEDFTSDDLLNTGFSSPGTTTSLVTDQPSMALQVGEEEQNQPIEIPRGTDDNSESLQSSHHTVNLSFQVQRTGNSL